MAPPIMKMLLDSHAQTLHLPDSTCAPHVAQVGGAQVLESDIVDLHAIWESTSFGLERLQCNPVCVDEEDSGTI